ncbi:YfhO family protein [Streptococcus suis]
MISVVLFPLIIAFLVFTLKEIKTTIKLSYDLYFTFNISSINLQPINLFCQGIHSPNMFL